MRRFTTVAAMALVFGLITAATAAAGQGNGPAVEREQGGGAGNGVCDGTGPSGDCDQAGEQGQFGPRDPDGAPAGGQNGEPIRDRDRDRDRYQACADPAVECTHNPAVDPVRERKQLRQQIWEHLGDGSGPDGATERSMWMLQRQLRLCIPISL